METKHYDMGFWHGFGITNIIITAGVEKNWVHFWFHNNRLISSTIDLRMLRKQLESIDVSFVCTSVNLFWL